MGFKTKTMFVILMAVVFFFSVVSAVNGDDKANKALLGNWDIEADMGEATFIGEKQKEE